MWALGSGGASSATGLVIVFFICSDVRSSLVVSSIMTPQHFADKWRGIHQKESAVSREHFIDLCRMLDQPTPTEADPAGHSYAFERKVRKTTGGKGFADVWKRGYFAWEYKGKRANLETAYTQLLLYREDLENPPLLTVCDLERFEIHTNFTGTPKKIHRFTLDDLEDKPATLELLYAAFVNPDKLNPKYERELVTLEATAKIGELVQRLRARGYGSEEVARFTMRMVFALFAEDVQLLPKRLVTEILERTRTRPDKAQRYFTDLFQAMAVGGEVLLHDVPHFNGGLFDGGGALALEPAELATLHQAAQLDWSEVEPAIFGTLFERSLDPAQRSQLRAHYTSREDILRIVEPVVMAPLRQEWEGVRQAVETYRSPDSKPKDKQNAAPLVAAFLHRLHIIKVGDFACGSGNFLYVAMQQLKDLELQVVTLAREIGAPGFPLVGPKQFYGMEVNVFAQQLASMVTWIGYLQWNRAHGLSNRQDPVLERLDNIRLRDALLDGRRETEWPEVDFIIGNPPFLGNYKMRRELGDDHVETLYRIYGGRVPNGVDLVCYWFEKARAQIAGGKAKRAGLIATNSIRQPKNNPVLRRIKESGDIFMAWENEEWVLEGGAVRVSIVGFDDGSQATRTLNGVPVPVINPDLTGTHFDISSAPVLAENLGRCFKGVEPAGPFDIPGDTARSWLEQPNPSGRNNADVLRHYVGAQEIVKKRAERWLIDFNQMPQAEAEEYLVPFAHVLEYVKPERHKNRREARKRNWWIHGESRPALRRALEPLERYIATPRVTKHPVYVWLSKTDLPSGALSVIATDSDFDYGVLNCHAHILWSIKRGSYMGQGDDPQYTNEVFESFPFPHADDNQRSEVARWGKHLDAVRSQLLSTNPKRTLTSAYNDLAELRVTRDSKHTVYALLLAHDKLDAAVTTAYGWEWPLSDEQILERLLAENLRRSASASTSPQVVIKPTEADE